MISVILMISLHLFHLRHSFEHVFLPPKSRTECLINECPVIASEGTFPRTSLRALRARFLNIWTPDQCPFPKMGGPKLGAEEIHQ